MPCHRRRNPSNGIVPVLGAARRDCECHFVDAYPRVLVPFIIVEDGMKQALALCTPPPPLPTIDKAAGCKLVQGATREPWPRSCWCGGLCLPEEGKREQSQTTRSLGATPPKRNTNAAPITAPPGSAVHGPHSRQQG